jgi:hypothetical protein
MDKKKSYYLVRTHDVHRDPAFVQVSFISPSHMQGFELNMVGETRGMLVFAYDTRAEALFENATIPLLRSQIDELKQEIEELGGGDGY